MRNSLTEGEIDFEVEEAMDLITLIEQPKPQKLLELQGQQELRKLLKQRRLQELIEHKNHVVLKKLKLLIILIKQLEQ